MTLPGKFEYPALYESASELSDSSQKSYLSLIRSEYGFLVIAAILSMDWSSRPSYFAIYVLILLGSLSVLIGRNYWKPEQAWYRGRALAESIKTSCWRYCMRADPFGDVPTREQAFAEFRDHLLEILKTNQFIGDRLSPDSSAKEQIPISMQAVRALSLDERKAYYLEHRIQEQRTWYAKKAGYNKRASRLWSRIGIGAYTIAISLALARIVYPEWKLWPIEPVLVIAAAIVGWTQVKKFNELASSYTLTAHEIGLIQGKMASATSEAAFSEFVNDSEQAFSREHTQWVARQQSQ